MTDITKKPSRRALLVAAITAPVMAAPAIAGMTPNPDQLLIDSCARVAEVERLISLAWLRVTGEDGNEEPDDIDDVYAEQSALYDTIVKTPPTTLAGFVAKARCTKICRPDERDSDESEYIDGLLTVTLINDLAAMEA